MLLSYTLSHFGQHQAQPLPSRPPVVRGSRGPRESLPRVRLRLGQGHRLAASRPGFSSGIRLACKAARCRGVNIALSGAFTVCSAKRSASPPDRADTCLVRSFTQGLFPTVIQQSIIISTRPTRRKPHCSMTMHVKEDKVVEAGTSAILLTVTALRHLPLGWSQKVRLGLAAAGVI